LPKKEKENRIRRNSKENATQRTQKEKRKMNRISDKE